MEKYLFREELTDMEERRAVYEILESCDGDFCPPISQRYSTSQKVLTEKEPVSDGVNKYFQGLLGQKTLLLKRDGEIIAFLSYRQDFTCEELSGYGPLYYLTTLCIRRDCRGLGYAPAIYRTLFEKVCGDNPHAYIGLRTWSTNKAQIYLMKELGFRCAVRLPDHRGKGIDTLYFIKRLS